MKLIDSTYSGYYSNQKDSIHLQSGSDKVINYDRYGNHLLAPGHTQITKGVKLAEGWMIVVFLLLILGGVWIRVFNYKRLRNVIQAFLSHLYSAHIIRENDSLMKRVLRVLNAVFIIVFSLFLYQLNAYYLINTTDLQHLPLFVVLCLCIFLIYQLKTWLFSGLGHILSKKDLTDEYIFNVDLANQILGLLLIPIVIGLAYIPFGKEVFISIGLIIIVFLYLFRLGRGFRIGVTKLKLSYFYLFLYLCTLEILPLAVLVRVFIENV